MTKSYQISKKDMGIETLSHAMYFTGNTDTVTKINHIPYQTIAYNDNGIFTTKLMNDTPIKIFIDNGATPSILPLHTYNKFPILHKYPRTAQPRQTLVIEDDSSLLAPSSINEPEHKETLVPMKRPESTAEVTSAGDTLISQVMPLLGITPSENTQLQNRNTPEDIADILGTRAIQRYVDMPLQTLDGIIVNQLKHFLPLAKEAKRIAEEIRFEQINEQWAGILQEQLLNQSFNDQLNSIQILEQLAPLQLAKEHLPGNIVDILERLGKADNIPLNQLYYIAEIVGTVTIVKLSKPLWLY